MNIDFPFQINHLGRTMATDYANHIRDLIEQLIFTNPGERVNRPDFGTGLLQMVFVPNSPELAATTQYLVQGALQQYLSNLIQVESVQVDSVDSTLTIVIEYIILRTQERQTAEFTRGV